ncbi:MAG: LysE family transporter [Oscillospiraceae bacterium]|nr:LysE family transporter [Oscillospiraceae bacterium]
MPSYVLGNFFVYAVINAITPGPGNILALSIVTNYGWKNGKPLFFGIFAGYYAVQFICAVFVYGVSAFLPQALNIMKYVGAAYILFLAVHIAISKPSSGDTEKSASFARGFMLQFVNVKIYLFGITALTGYITDYSSSLWVLVLFEMIIATIGTMSTLMWTGMGALIQKFYKKHYRTINIILALALLECIFSMLK